ncbi:NTP pyrophosphohydrolase [Peterkaempfera sp. SMS 1(5)a]|uniref:NTP pyrophosphohydrolase n=1 Tax=Peterkaempfera podocarpi TaxID=3232308 RepID=UPI00366F1FE5
MTGPAGDREQSAPGTPPLLIVDGANVVGSVPDGWWRDRPAAAARLRDALVAVAERGLPDAGSAPEWARGRLEVLLVVEGAARGLAEVPGVRVASAAGSGDDLIVRLAGEAGQRRCLVVTADRELRSRVVALGAEVVGPRTVRPR